MAKRVLTVLIWGLAGLVVALGFTAGAFALVGGDIAEPGEPPVFTPSLGPRASPSVGRDDPASRSPEPSATPSPSQGGDDDDNSGPGSGDDSGSDDSSGPGSGGSDDNSGPGSDNSGSGSDDSGSGSDHDDD